MRIGDLMTQEVALTHPDETIQQAAARMAEADVGMLPVGEEDRLIGMLTDRDIAVRGAARGKGPKQARVRDIMTLGVEYCFDDEDADNVARRMGELRLRRLAVLNREKWLVGVVSLADIATRHDAVKAGTALRNVCGNGHDAAPEIAAAG